MKALDIPIQSALFPKHWDIFQFERAILDKTGGNLKIKRNEYLEAGKLPVIDQGHEYISGYINDCGFKCNAPLPCILFGDHTKIIKFVNQPFALGADGVKVLVPDERLDPLFTYYYLKHIRLPDNTGYSRHFKFLKRNYIPVPPIKEQKRIAAILDKADAIRRKRQKATQLADDFLRSVFLDMFGDPVTNPKGWERETIKKLGLVTTGNTPSRMKPDYYGDYIEWIKSDNINTPYHFLTEAEEKLSEEGKAVGRVVPAVSILVTCIAGSFDCIGNAALTDREVAFNQQINAITPFKGIDPFFLYTQILIAKKLIQNTSTNSMKGMISKGKFEQISLLNPPSPLQKKFGYIFQKILKTNNEINQSSSKGSDLFNSLTQRAFRGEL